MKKFTLSAAALLVCSLLNAQSAFTWDVTSYKGAFPVTDNTPATDWTSGWTEWDPEAKFMELQHLQFLVTSLQIQH